MIKNEIQDTDTPPDRVLVVEEDDQICKLMTRVFQKYRIDSLTVSDPAAAVDQFKNAHCSGRAFDLVILDLHMRTEAIAPKVLEKLKKIDPEVRALLSSGDLFNPIMINFYQFGFQGTLTKPCRVQKILAEVTAALKKG